MLQRGVSVVVPEIVDYEIRRELLRANKQQGLQRLDRLIGALEYAPLTTPAMKLAAQFWAQARRTGNATTDDRHLDCDVILAAQANLSHRDGDTCVIATTNVRHLQLFVPAQHWEEWT